ncbi:hypothetical protein J1N35_010390 [Gossypium stocksii]|uniref:Uncharacterized protein n=1 Tax=Gossypium stocksii TaxID=47602 RepID=A0A9D3W113_9ROSI|nr:hypothetical protein J1N35_010390 [Gossypium stocksii]
MKENIMHTRNNGSNDNNVLQLRPELGALLVQEEVFWRERARVLWMCHGDTNTNFFLAQAKKFRRALFEMHPYKTLDPDGLNATFYQNCRNTIGEEVVNECYDWLNRDEFPSVVNDTIVVLILKKKNPTSIRDLGPITLCNVV